ncbi:hypothetical protein XFPR_03855 [Xylella fastidiosa]|uniref:Uncharacterized protein n=1 Tax=Xylella fastidiosa TaxID=2371 RepID=A0ABC8AE91_XYLFS|nr:hypothetical protein [Xylella fastidiosa]ALR02055.1 hypothetical protein OY18_07205 [Xylella fastidiosa]ALR03888.1 hypothetical protein XFPR_03855 [Xylella fastidiosa]ALR06895.1 hypothetical protein XFHB_08605 [Xylella fastidiosa]AVI20418.1 hypothetical protein BCV75_03510 [Xylella fastidiosa]AVI22429.1 hypothetical protein BC375_03540 [Xylella fastidiosa]
MLQNPPKLDSHYSTDQDRMKTTAQPMPLSQNARATTHISVNTIAVLVKETNQWPSLHIIEQ